MRGTHTFSLLELSGAAYREIAGKLRAAGYDHAFTEMDSKETIDMHGIGVTCETVAAIAQAPAVTAQTNIGFARELTPEVEATIDDMFEYHAWNQEQQAAGAAVRKVLAAAVKVIVSTVPPGPDRTVAIRKLREARMDANSAITHRGKY